jgi:hypothetical protein
MVLLTVTYDTGRVSVLTFASHFDRALVVVTLSAQPVTLTLTETA